jgi:protein farnesyltransferase subunit beta
LSGYCAAAIAQICGLLDTPGLFNRSGDWLSSCQTYEGGFGGEPGCEAHVLLLLSPALSILWNDGLFVYHFHSAYHLDQGGYSYCAVAALSILKHENWDKVSYLRWAFQRQAPEGGFNGRANKLVDGCYSFWQLGGITAADANFLELFDHHRLQRYILATCQCASGGLLDKVGKAPDLYHTCYVLSGLHLSRVYSEFKNVPSSNEALLNVSSRKLPLTRFVSSIQIMFTCILMCIHLSLAHSI